MKIEFDVFLIKVYYFISIFMNNWDNNLKEI